MGVPSASLEKGTPNKNNNIDNNMICREHTIQLTTMQLQCNAMQSPMRYTYKYKYKYKYGYNKYIYIYIYVLSNNTVHYSTVQCKYGQCA